MCSVVLPVPLVPSPKPQVWEPIEPSASLEPPPSKLHRASRQNPVKDAVGGRSPALTWRRLTLVLPWLSVTVSLTL